jgi:serine/threonine protein kinase/tetratricopeptide (TPR) repeat protein
MRQSIGRYAVTGMLGEGGMGVVYAAYDDRLGRPLAIKMIKAAIAEPSARDRFANEARAAAGVNHPAICQLYEIGEADGELFLAMELLQGESLATRIARSPLPLTETVSTALGILSGIGALHQHGLVHRDLKPSNIFLTPHGVKLLDFGLTSGMQTANDETMVRLTSPGTILGTPQYASPEQLRGEPVDARSDVFAAGVIVYEMLTGEPPFVGRSAVEVFHATLYEQPPVLTGGPAVAALDRAVHRAVAKKPQERFASAEAMAADLRSALMLDDSETSVSVHPVTRLIVLPFRVLRPDPETDFLSFSLADAVTSSLSGLQSLVVRSSLAAARFASDAPDVKAIASSADVDAVLVGSLLRAGGELRVATQLLEAHSATVMWSHTAQVPVGDLFRLLDELTNKIVESLSLPLTAREQRMLGQDVPSSPRAYDRYLRANELSRNTVNRRAAMDLYQHAVDEDPRFAPAWAGLGRMHWMLGKYGDDETGDQFRQAEASLKRALELNPELSAAENIYAHLEVDMGRAEAAMVRLTRCARTRTADPELFAGLTHACRYCGLLQASLAAADQARRLDPRVRMSEVHTHFMLGDYRRVADLEDGSGNPYMRSLGLFMMGRTADALQLLDTFDASSQAQSRLAIYAASLRHLISGNNAEAVALTLRLTDIRDPEGRFYLARQLAYAGQTDEALDVLNRVVEDGFFCLPVLGRDPWLDRVRGTAGFVSILHRAEARHRRAVLSFFTAEGDRALGVSQPV